MIGILGSSYLGALIARCKAGSNFGSAGWLQFKGRISHFKMPKNSLLTELDRLAFTKLG